MKDEIRKALMEIRVEDGRKRLLRHAVVYVLVMALLVTLALTVTERQLWVVWVALGWGTGLALHALGLKRTERALMAAR